MNKYFCSLSDKDKVLYLLCRANCQLDMSGVDYIVATKNLTKSLCCTKSKAYKLVSELCKEGLAQKVSKGMYNEEYMVPVVYRGWSITSKVRYMEIYRRANWDESKLVKEIFGIVPSQFYKTNTAKWYERKERWSRTEGSTENA